MIDEYIADIVNTKFLILERAVDEFIQAQNDILLESETISDSFVDSYIDEMNESDVDEIMNGELEMEYDISDNDDYVGDNELSDINVIIDASIDPIVDELD